MSKAIFKKQDEERINRFLEFIKQRIKDRLTESPECGEIRIEFLTPDPYVNDLRAEGEDDPANQIRRMMRYQPSEFIIGVY